MAVTRPLPQQKARTGAVGLGPGMWRATVASAAPLTVTVPLWLGVDAEVPAESAVFSVALARGDAVWVSRVGGTDAVVVVARRV